MRGRVLIAVGLGAIGLVWIGQGLGLLQGSGFMVDDVRWAVAGGALLILGAVVLVSALRSRPKA